jgi:hypothetical protein
MWMSVQISCTGVRVLFRFRSCDFGRSRTLQPPIPPGGGPVIPDIVGRTQQRVLPTSAAGSQTRRPRGRNTGHNARQRVTALGCLMPKALHVRAALAERWRLATRPGIVIVWSWQSTIPFADICAASAAPTLNSASPRSNAFLALCCLTPPASRSGGTTTPRLPARAFSRRLGATQAIGRFLSNTPNASASNDTSNRDDEDRLGDHGRPVSNPGAGI